MTTLSEFISELDHSDVCSLLSGYEDCDCGLYEAIYRAAELEKWVGVLEQIREAAQISANSDQTELLATLAAAQEEQE